MSNPQERPCHEFAQMFSDNFSFFNAIFLFLVTLVLMVIDRDISCLSHLHENCDLPPFIDFVTGRSQVQLVLHS